MAKGDFKRKARDWFERNQEKIAFWAPIVIMGAGIGFKVGTRAWKTHNLNLERKLKENYIYDRSFGMYVELKRPLNSEDWKNLNNLKASGFSTSESLQKLNLIK